MHEQSLFIEALEKEDPAERAAFLDQVCAGDPPLRRRIDTLLERHEQSGSFLEAPSAGFVSTAAEPITERPGTMIGPYKLMEQIGEGGMGLVFVAEQQKPVRRRVALKLIKPGMDSRQIIARFEAERQALALMDHPNIAKILDAGTTEPIADLRSQNSDLKSEISNLQSAISHGRPYFVMELVKGVPITVYCDDNRLTPRARLELFSDVCAAVQHAHQKGIIHRDIKPSNVLVVSHDGTPVVKVIDFGVAKAIGQQLTDKTVYTHFAQFVGTPLYMSPEQAGQSGLDVDTRTDIYALGVLLYELLTGTTPFDKIRMREAGYDEMRRLIREEEPPKPSTRISTLGQAGSTVSAQRQSDPKQLCKLVRGELDWIVMKALEKDRNRRYESASALAADVQRYLHDEPVLASPSSAFYRLRKALRRHKAPAIAACVSVLSLIGGLIGTTWGLVKTENAWQAEALRADGERQAKELAQAREAETKAVLEFVENQVFAAARPDGELGGLGHDVTLRRALDAALPFVATSFMSQPLIEARLRKTLGISFLYLGESRTATEQFEMARALYVKHYGPDHPDTLMSKCYVASGYTALGRYADALKLHEETLTLLKAKLGPDHRNTLYSMNCLAIVYGDLGRYPDALKLSEETLALRKAKLGPYHRDTLVSMSNLAIVYKYLGRSAAALKLDEETLALRKAKLGPLHPDTLQSMNNLACSLRGKAGLKLNEETLPLLKAKLGPYHPFTLMSMANLAGDYNSVGRKTEALKLYEETLALQKDRLGLDHPNTLVTMLNLNIVYGLLGRHDDAIKLGEVMVPLMKSKLGPDHPYTLRAMGNLTADYVMRLREFVRQKDVASCRHLCDLCEKLNPDSSDCLYNAACGRALTAALLREIDMSPEGVKEADSEADRAMALLKQAIDKGYKNTAEMEKDADLDSLRDREDFQELYASLRELYASLRFPGLVLLEAKLDKTLSGEMKLTDPVELVALAEFCRDPYKQLYAASARLYREAFATGLVNASSETGYHFACAAALAGCGEGKDGAALEPGERSRLRGEALAWLRGELPGYRRAIISNPERISGWARHWQQNPDFKGVRGDEALAKLPEAERQEWRKLWREVEELARRATEKG